MNNSLQKNNKMDTHSYKGMNSPSTLCTKESESKNSLEGKSHYRYRSSMGQKKSKSELKSDKNYTRYLPLLTMDKSNNCFSINNKIKNMKQYNDNISVYSQKSSDELQKTLSFNVRKMIKNKTELKELRLQYNKLFEDNQNNSKLLARMMGVKNNKQYKKEEIIAKLKNCTFDKKSKRQIIESINLINLKLELNEKKSILKSKAEEFFFLKENSKAKYVTDLKRDLSNKQDIKIELQLNVEKIKEVLEQEKKTLKETEDECKKLDAKYKEVKKEEKDILKKIDDKMQKIFELQNLTRKLDKNIQNQEKIYKINLKNKSDIILNIEQKEKKINEINEYKSKREQIQSDIDKNREKIKEYKDKSVKLEEEYNKLNKENDNLNQKNDNLAKKEKLNKKKKDTEGGGKKVKMYEELLKKIKSEFQSIKKEYESQKSKNIELSKRNKEIIKKNQEEINKRKEIINDMENKKNLLKMNIQNSIDSLNKIKNEIEDRKKKLDIDENKNNLFTTSKETDELINENEREE